MIESLERLATEVRKLTPEEVQEFSVWLVDYQLGQNPPSTAQEKRVDWSDLPGRVRKIFGNKPPLKENVVLALRREERF